MLNEQLKQQIIDEAEAGANQSTDSAVGIGYNTGYRSGYLRAGNKYAELWQAAEERAARAEKEAKRLCRLADDYAIALMKIGSGCENPKQVANKALTPKTGEDERRL